MKKKTKKHVKTTIAAALAVGSVVAVAPMATQASTQFTDVKVNDYYYEDVLQLAERGVVNGFSDGTFKPKQDVTRGQAAKIIAGVLGLDTTNVSNPGFKDVTTSNQYYGAIAALANAGIINGFEDGTFRPGDAVQRNHMAKIIAGAFKLEAPADFKTPLKDVRADYAQYVTALYSAGVTTGKTATTFDGSSNVTRGQLASFVVRAENAGKITAPVAKDVTFTISQVDGSKVEGYTIPTALQGLLNEANNAALVGAIVSAKVLGDEIVSINSLQLNAPGTEGALVTLDGGNSTIAGDLIVNADYVEVKNVTVQGNVSLTNSVKSEFSADVLINDGEFIVEDVSSPVASVTPIFANTTNGPKIALKNSNVKKVHVKRDNVVLSSNVKLPEVTVSAKVSAIQVDADVAKLKVDVTVNIAITGAGSFDEVSLEKAVEVALAIVGKISKLVVYNTDAKVDLAASIKIGNVVLPANSTAKDIIKNYESIKGNINNVVIGDKPTTPGSGGSGSSGGGSGSGDSGSSGGDSGSGGSNPEVEAPVTVTGVSAIIGDDGKGITVTASVANTTASTATIEFYEVDNGVVAPSPNYTRQADIKDGKVNFWTAELPAGTYQVKVKVGSVSAAASAFVTVLSGDQTAPTAVTNVAGTSSDIDTEVEGGLQNTISWTANTANDLDYYEVYRTINADGITDAIKVGTNVNKGTETITDSAVIAGVTYYYTVYAVNKSGNKSSMSNIAKVETVRDQASVEEVTSITELTDALADETIKTITLANDIETTEEIVVDRAVTINGNGHKVTMTDDGSGWQGDYVFHVYKATGVTISNVALTGADGALLVNGSAVKLTGTIDVSGNEFGGIEVSKGQNVDSTPSLNVIEATLLNENEAYGLPTIWEDKITGTVTVATGQLTSTSTVKENQVQYYLTAANSENPSVEEVTSITELTDALADETIKTITLANDIETTEEIVVDRAVTINGNGHKVTMTDDGSGWQGDYVFHVYKATGVTISNVALTGADGALLVNGSAVKLTGTIDVSGNEFGGIEVSKGQNVDSTPSLNVIEATLLNENEAYGLPTIWEDKITGTVTVATGQLTSTSTVKENQVQYYLTAANSENPSVEEVTSITELTDALADETIKTITLANDIETTEEIVVDRAVTINGNGHKVTMTDDGSGWQGDYVFHVYKATGVTISNVALTGADGALLVNGSAVKLTGTIDVSGNEFGGIEVSKGQNVDSTPSLNVIEATLLNENEAYGLPTIWEDKITGTVTVATGQLTSTSTVKENQVQYYLTAANSENPSVEEVTSITELTDALADETIKTITLANDIETTEEIVVDRAVTINGNGHKVTMTDDGSGWQGDYVFHVYKATGVTISNVALTGADGALLVNGSAVKLTGTIDVSGNEFGGIEVSKGQNVDSTPSLNVIEATLLNENEAYGLPTIWEDKITGTVTVATGQLTSTSTVKENQVQYYLTAANSENPSVEEVTSITELTDALADETIKTITLANDIETTEEIVVDRAVTINGNGHKVTMTDDGSGWQGDYVFHVYKATGVTISNVALTGADGALLVNGSAVKLTGTIDVSGNEFGGIEVSKGQNVDSTPSLNVIEATLLNENEAYGLPTIWEDKITGTVTVATGQLTSTSTVKENQVQYYLTAANSENPSVEEVTSITELTDALADETIKTITLANDIETTEEIVVDRAVTINGNGHKVTMTDDGSGWQGDYVFHVYKATGVTISNVALTGADGALLVNGSAVKLTGTIDVSGNEFGGIEVSKGQNVDSTPSLNVIEATLLNENEAYGLPTIWEDKITGTVTVATGQLTSTSTVKENQVQYYLTAANSENPSVEEVTSITELTDALADETIKTITLANDIETTEEIVVDRAVTINGNGHKVTMTDDGSGWQGDYVFHVYKATGVTISNVALTGADGALLVNGSAVKLTGTIDVSGNEFGGIEVSKGQNVDSTPSLNVIEATLLNENEAYGLPTIWEDKITGTVTVATGQLTSTSTVKENQVQYYLTAANSENPSVEEVYSIRKAQEPLTTLSMGENFVIQDGIVKFI